MKKNITIFSNCTENSIKTEHYLCEKLNTSNFSTSKNLTKDTELIICIGGDGTLLEGVHHFKFPKIPFLGINTGHLGFFQEIQPNQLSDFVESYNTGKYRIQELSTLDSIVEFSNSSNAVKINALNEIVVRSPKVSRPIHLNLWIDKTFMEKFSGDGISISSSAGSTAYNYSLGGSILDPSLNALQITPISPMNNKAYRSFTSSILLSSERTIAVIPEESEHPNFGDIKISADHLEFDFSNVSSISLTLSNKKLSLLRFSDYNFWKKIKNKFL